jgi:membrane protease YdiL (CAAX protease family)
MFTIVIVFAAFIVYYVTNNLKPVNDYFIKRIGEESGQIRLIVLQRLRGVLLFGLLPCFFMSGLNGTGMVFSYLKISFSFLSLLAVVVLGAIAVTVNYFVARSSENLSVYPQIRAKNWSLALLLLSFLSWMSYLFAYEFLLRGILLFSCINDFGVIAAVAINIIIYAIVHIPKGIKEMLGSIPLGLIFCILTINFGTIWAAFWIHCTLALSNECFSIKYHPDIKVSI